MSWNRVKNPLKALVILGIIALCLYEATPVQKKINLGLDLKGGVRVLLQLNPNEHVKAITSEVQGQVLQVIDNRINGLGVTEPVLTRVGTDRILAELPGVKNQDEATRTMKEVAQLEFKIVSPDVRNRADRGLAPGASAADKAYTRDGAYKDGGATVYSGAELAKAVPAPSQYSSAAWNIDFTTKDPKKFADLTSKNIGHLLTIFLDKHYISSATIQSTIGENGQITGSFTQEQATVLSNELNAGALPVGITIIENDSIGPTLGAIDLTKSLYASMFGLGLVLLFMIFVYRLPGLLAGVALIIYVLMMLGLLASAKATLTLPGIAGFVLSIGMAVDANVLIFERLKEELWSGKSLRAAVRTGFSRAFSAVFDSHFTTIVGAGVLFMLGTGTVKGFAYTLFWGTVFSLVTAVFITRFFIDILVNNDLITAPAAYGVKSEEIGTLAKAGA
ncbi:MAG: protein translocase subunit SecD [Candidatus Eremiobacteraeota bacterium]|nr:protein translocase subunit SecD [Candidatus Eremiobacteraeota bacterium]